MDSRLQHSSPWTFLVKNIIKAGRLDLLKTLEADLLALHEQNDLIYLSILYDRLPILKWLWDEKKIRPQNTITLLSHPLLLNARNGSLDVFKWLMNEKGISTIFNDKDIIYLLIINAIAFENKNVANYLLDYLVNHLITKKDHLIEQQRHDKDSIACIVWQKKLNGKKNDIKALQNYLRLYPFHWPFLLKDATFFVELISYSKRNNLLPFTLFLCGIFIHVVDLPQHYSMLTKWSKILDKHYQLTLALLKETEKIKGFQYVSWASLTEMLLIQQYENAYREVIQSLNINNNKNNSVLNNLIANRLSHEHFPFFNAITLDLFSIIGSYLSPHDVFFALRFTNTKTYNMVMNRFFIQNKIIQYFGYCELKTSEDYYLFFKSQYLYHISNFRYLDQLHACLTDNLSYTMQVADPLLFTEAFPNNTDNSMFDFLMNGKKYAGLNSFLSLLKFHQNNDYTFGSKHFPKSIIFARFNQLESLKKTVSNFPECIHLKSQNGYNALMHAVFQGNTDVVKYLLEKKINLEVMSKLNPQETALDIAISKRQLLIIPILLDAYREIPTFKHNYSPFMCFAAERGYLDVIRVLVEYDSNFLHEVDRLKQSAFLIAAKAGHQDIVKFLLTKSSDLIYCQTSALKHPDGILVLPSDAAIDGKTAIDWAVSNKHDSVIQILKSHLEKIVKVECDYILSTFKSPWLTSFSIFSKTAYEQLSRRLAKIEISAHTPFLKLNSILCEIIRTYNKSVPDNFLLSLLQKSLIKWFGNDRYLKIQENKKLMLEIPAHYLTLFDIKNEEVSVKPSRNNLFNF